MKDIIHSTKEEWKIYEKNETHPAILSQLVIISSRTDLIFYKIYTFEILIKRLNLIAVSIMYVDINVI